MYNSIALTNSSLLENSNAILADAPSALTVSLWIKTTTVADGYIASKTNYGDPNGWVFVYLPGSSTVIFEMQNLTGSNSFSSSFNDGNWHNLVVSYDGSVGTSLYLDGVAQTQVASQPLGTTGSTSAVFTIGAYSRSTLLGQYFDIRLYSYAVSPAQAVTLSMGGDIGPTLLAEWPVTETSGVSFSDSTGNGNTLTSIGAVTFSSTDIPAQFFSGIHNADFENWNFGTTFSNPASGTQLADYWYIDTVFGGDTITRESTIVQHGTYSLKWQTPNDSGEIYQTIYVSNLAGQIITLSGYVYTNTGYFTINIYDGTTLYQSAPSSGSGNWEKLSVSYTVPVSPVPLTISVSKNVGGATPLVYIDNFTLVNSSILTLGLSDSLSVSDAPIVPSYTITKSLSDSIAVSDSAPGSFSAQSDYLAPVTIPVVEQLVKQLAPATTKLYFKIEE